VRVALRHPRASDEAEYARLRAASWSRIREWEPTPPGATASHGRDAPDEDHSAVFERFLETSNTSQSQRMLIVRVASGGVDARAWARGNSLAGDAASGVVPGAIIGQVSLNHMGFGAIRGCAAGYWIGEGAQGQGLMAEALGLALDVAFDAIRLHRVEANIIPRNARSIALVRRLGFRNEGTSKAFLRINGAWQDHERWAILDEEWRAARVRVRGT
jgi:ribosomal-protein-alanine N-acetyltransferase